MQNVNDIVFHCVQTLKLKQIFCQTVFLWKSIIPIMRKKKLLNAQQHDVFHLHLNRFFDSEGERSYLIVNL